MEFTTYYGGLRVDKLAIKGGEPVRKKTWPSWPVHDEKEKKNILEVLESGKWWYGERVKEFEEKFAAFQDANFGVTCTNGTAALEASLVALGIGDGDEVIVPPYTFIATASTVLKVRAIPVFADIELDTANIEPEDIKNKITPKTKAIVPVHFAGYPCDMDVLSEIANEHSLHIIEDACHSWGSKWKGKGTGALGDCGAFSFQMSKNITSGEGGIVLTDKEELADIVRSYTNVGRGKDKPWYEHYRLGDNLRMTEFQAAVLLAQLTRLEKQTIKREENVSFLNEKLKEQPGIALMRDDERVTRRSYHIYMFRFIEEEWNISRSKFLEALNAEGIPASGGYPHPIYKNPFFQSDEIKKWRDYTDVKCSNTEQFCSEVVWMSHSMFLAEKEDMNDIESAIRKVWKNRKELM